MAKMFETKGVYNRTLQTLSPQKAAPKTTDKPRNLRTNDGRVIADIRSGPRGVTMNIPARTADGFDTWINANAETLMAELHTRWAQSRNEDQ